MPGLPSPTDLTFRAAQAGGRDDSPHQPQRVKCSYFQQLLYAGWFAQLLAHEPRWPRPRAPLHDATSPRPGFLWSLQWPGSAVAGRGGPYMECVSCEPMAKASYPVTPPGPPPQTPQLCTRCWHCSKVMNAMSRLWEELREAMRAHWEVGRAPGQEETPEGTGTRASPGP